MAKEVLDLFGGWLHQAKKLYPLKSLRIFIAREIIYIDLTHLRYIIWPNRKMRSILGPNKNIHDHVEIMYMKWSNHLNPIKLILLMSLKNNSLAWFKWVWALHKGQIMTYWAKMWYSINSSNKSTSWDLFVYFYNDCSCYD